MTVYDEVNNLARAIRESKEYKEYKAVKEELMKTPDLKAKVDEFEKIRYEEQLLAMQGEQQTAEKMKKLQELYEILVKNPSIKEYFDGIGEIFNPNVSYEGNYAFCVDVFSMVGKKQTGKNLVDEYLEKKYYKQIREILQKMKFSANPKLFVVSDLSGNYGRNLKMSIELFIMEFAHILTGSTINFSGNDETIKDEAVQFFRNYRKQLSEIQNGNITEENKSINENLRKDYILNEEHRKKVMGREYRPISYERYLEVKKDYITNFIVGLRYLVPMFDKPINLEELQECLDLEKFYLAMAKQMIDVTHTTLNSPDKAVHNSFVFVEKYIIKYLVGVG